MSVNQIADELETLLLSGATLLKIVAVLREYEKKGVLRTDVQMALEALRDGARDEGMEDRVLEVMDIVQGFCRRELAVWGD